MKESENWMFGVEFTCGDDVDGVQTRNHHFCQSPFSARRRTLNRRYNGVDCKRKYFCFAFIILQRRGRGMKRKFCVEVNGTNGLHWLIRWHREYAMLQSTRCWIHQYWFRTTVSTTCRKIHKKTSNRCQRTTSHKRIQLTILAFVVFRRLLFVTAATRNHCLVQRCIFNDLIWIWRTCAVNN